ncbi:uncharacterized protein [Leptinotarsa decemlineata]|uniref:uncharacterized protein n=1 Tax=Leptinotarsa decemlineata TaxID=7539 RepID=UPI000C25538C|nr:uncharacterized protein LOC111517153 [Leptinotarsa decemlineata]
MLTTDEDIFELKIPGRFGDDDLTSVEFNISTVFLPSSGDSSKATGVTDPEYEQFLADVWVGIVLTLMVLSCVCFMCSCLIYHKFQQWKTRVMEARNAANLESTVTESELPSYTTASGLPTYEEALEQLKKVKDFTTYTAKRMDSSDWTPHTPPTPATPATLSVANLFAAYKGSANDRGSSVKNSMIV